MAISPHKNAKVTLATTGRATDFYREQSQSKCYKVVLLVIIVFSLDLDHNTYVLKKGGTFYFTHYFFLLMLRQ